MYHSRTDFKKYYGKRKYKEIEKELRLSNNQIAFTEDQKIEMLGQMIDYIEKEDFALYHDFMDNISVEREDWFNLMCFDGKAKRFLLEYIKSRVQDKLHGAVKIDRSCHSMDEPIEHNCNSCGLNCGGRCGGSGKRPDNGEDIYGMDTDDAVKLFPNGCPDYELSYRDYEVIEERAELKELDTRVQR